MKISLTRILLEALFPVCESADRTAARSRSVMELDIDLDGVRKIVIEVDD